jgi:hypothetical protein
MQKSAGVNPIITLLALAIGFELSGVIGLLISVPVFLSNTGTYKEYCFKKDCLASKWRLCGIMMGVLEEKQLLRS